MQILLRERDCGPCPYLEGRAWRIRHFSSPLVDPGLYEELLARGFRRSGSSFYMNACPGCGLCVPLRIAAGSLEPTASQRRLGRRNADLTLELLPASFSEERFGLYRLYVKARHGEEEGEGDAAREAYSSFLLESPVPGTSIAEYRLPGGALAATGYLDVLPEGLSSVYFAFDPAESRRSIGTWSVGRELELAASLGKRYYYLGFWVPGSAKMDYKADFRPFEIARNGRWLPARDRSEALAALEIA